MACPQDSCTRHNLTLDLPVEYRRLSADDIVGMQLLLAEIRPSFGRMSSDSAYHALMLESLKQRGLWWIVAIAEGVVAGFVVACRNRPAFWRRFMARHPALLVRLAADSATRLCRSSIKSPARGSIVRKHLEVDGAGPKWSDNDATIAKVLYVAVSEPFRGHGIATGLYRALMDLLIYEGITRIDTHIDSDNAASYRSVQKCGWALRRDSSGFLGTVLLPDRRR